MKYKIYICSQDTFERLDIWGETNSFDKAVEMFRECWRHGGQDAYAECNSMAVTEVGLNNV